MLIDLRINQYRPGRFADSLRKYERSGHPALLRHSELIAMMVAESGIGNRTLQMFAYRDAAHRDTCRDALQKDAEWQSFIGETADDLVEQSNVILRPMPFSDMRDFEHFKDPARLVGAGGKPMLFELRSYITRPGMLAAALQMLRDEGIPITHEYVERPLAYFTTETGPSNRLIMLWAYTDNAERDRRRDLMRADSRFKDIGPRFNPLFAYQEGELWLAMPYSPLR